MIRGGQNSTGSRTRIRNTAKLTFVGIRIDFGWLRDPGPDPREQKLHTKIEKVKNFHVLTCAGCSPLRVEGFSCILGVLYLGLWIG